MHFKFENHLKIASNLLQSLEQTALSMTGPIYVIGECFYILCCSL